MSDKKEIIATNIEKPVNGTVIAKNKTSLIVKGSDSSLTEVTVGKFIGRFSVDDVVNFSSKGELVSLTSKGKPVPAKKSAPGFGSYKARQNS